MKRNIWSLVFILCLVTLAGCYSVVDKDSDTGGDSDVDADTDTDTDTDTDADTDTDSDVNTDNKATYSCRYDLSRFVYTLPKASRFATFGQNLRRYSAFGASHARYLD